jgi:hypothetical protein
VKERNAKHEASLFEDNIFTRADTSTGRELTRNDNYAKPMLLSIDVLPRVLKDEIRDITTRRAIIEADRFLRHPDVRRTIEDVLSPEHYDQFNGWLLSLANDAAVRLPSCRCGTAWRTSCARARRWWAWASASPRWSCTAPRPAWSRSPRPGLQDDGQGHLQQENVGRPGEGAGPRVAGRGLASSRATRQWVDNANFITERSPRCATA